MKITQKTIDLLQNHKIFSTYNGVTRFKPGDNIIISPNIEIEPYTCYFTSYIFFQMGAFSYSFSPLPTDAVVNRYCSIAKGTRLFGTRHPYERFTNSSVTYDAGFCLLKECVNDSKIQGRGGVTEYMHTPIPPYSPTHIENDVWIGANAVLKPGITINNGAIVGTEAVVTKDVPPYAIVGGNPARILKMRFDDKIIEELLKLQWWDYCFADFGIKSDINVEEFIYKINNDIASGKLQKYNPVPVTGKDILSTVEQ